MRTSALSESTGATFRSRNTSYTSLYALCCHLKAYLLEQKVEVIDRLTMSLPFTSSANSHSETTSRHHYSSTLYGGPGFPKEDDFKPLEDDETGRFLNQFI